MGRIQSRERPPARASVRDDRDRRRIVVDAGMLVFLIGLALLFVTNAPN